MNMFYSSNSPVSGRKVSARDISKRHRVYPSGAYSPFVCKGKEPASAQQPPFYYHDMEDYYTEDPNCEDGDSEAEEYDKRYDPDVYDGTYEPDGSGYDYDYDDNGYGPEKDDY